MIQPAEIPLSLPKQFEGSHTEFQDSISFDTNHEAQDFYKEAKDRLLDVNDWGTLCRGPAATFQLTDEKGNHTHMVPQESFFFKIDIPGPGSSSGKGFDWVQVEEIDEKTDVEANTEYLSIRVRPASDPTTSNSKTAHFFSSKATSNFLVLRKGKEVTAAVFGRNELNNTKRTNNFFDKIRNFLIGTSARAGMAAPQWQGLIKGVLGKQQSP